MSETKQTLTTVRLTSEDKKIIAALKKKLGANFTSIFRQAVRVYAEQQGLR